MDHVVYNAEESGYLRAADQLSGCWKEKKVGTV